MIAADQTAGKSNFRQPASEKGCCMLQPASPSAFVNAIFSKHGDSIPQRFRGKIRDTLIGLKIGDTEAFRRLRMEDLWKFERNGFGRTTYNEFREFQILVLAEVAADEVGRKERIIAEVASLIETTQGCDSMLVAKEVVRLVETGLSGYTAEAAS